MNSVWANAIQAMYNLNEYLPANVRGNPAVNIMEKALGLSGKDLPRPVLSIPRPVQGGADLRGSSCSGISRACAATLYSKARPVAEV